MDWDRAKIKETLEILAQLPDFENMLFPDSWATEYNIPITPARALDLKEYLRKHKQSMIMPGEGKKEIREPAEGGVREITAEDILEIEHKYALVDVSGNKEFGFILEMKDDELEKMPELIEQKVKEIAQTLLSPTGTTKEEAAPFDGNGGTGE